MDGGQDGRGGDGWLHDRCSSVDELLARAIAAINRGDRAAATTLAEQVLAADRTNPEAEDLLAAPIDEKGDDTPPGEPGEIICRSPASMIGYYRKPEATAATLVDGWLHTGDLGYVDDDGFIYIAGRAKDMLNTGGLNVYPAEVERVITQHPAVYEAAVIGVPDDKWGEIGHALVVLHPGGQLTEPELLDYLGPELAKYKIPTRFTIRKEPLPRTTSGKVQKFVVREQVGLSETRA